MGTDVAAFYPFLISKNRRALTVGNRRRNLQRHVHDCLLDTLGAPPSGRSPAGDVGDSALGSSAAVHGGNIVRFFCKLVFAVALLTAVSGRMTGAEAQGLTGQISGIVTDSGGGVLPGATVTIKNAGTNQSRETVTGADGAFTFPDLLAGTYDLSVGVQGFKTYEQK